MSKKQLPPHHLETLERIGARLRQERKNQGLSLEVLAQKAGISKMTLHRIETGVSSPSIITLAEISYHLKQPLEAFFQEGEAKVVVIKKEAQEKLLDNEYGIRVVAPAGLISERIIMTYASLEEGTYIEEHTNKGFEWAILLKGRAVVGVNGCDYPLEAGDSILFDAHFSHSISVEDRIEYVNLFLRDE